jgi:hypothetical protein
MSRLGGYHCAIVVLLLGLAGCTTTDLLVIETRSSPVEAPQDRIIPAPPGKVYEYARAVLHENNMMCQASQEGEAIRLACLPESHTQFSLMLTPWPIRHNLRTRVHVGWDHAPEPENDLNDPVIERILDAIERKCTEDLQRWRAEQPATSPQADR